MRVPDTKSPRLHSLLRCHQAEKPFSRRNGRIPLCSGTLQEWLQGPQCDCFAANLVPLSSGYPCHRHRRSSHKSCCWCQSADAAPLPAIRLDSHQKSRAYPLSVSLRRRYPISTDDRPSRRLISVHRPSLLLTKVDQAPTSAFRLDTALPLLARSLMARQITSRS